MIVSWRIKHVSAAVVAGLIGLFFTTTPASADLLDDIRAGQARKIVIIGTSLSTTRFGNWPSLMEAWLKSEAPDPNDVTVVNLSVSSSSSDNANAATSGIQTQLPNAIAANPDTVFMEFSINDAYTPYGISQAQSEANFNTIINGLKAHNSNIEIIIQTMNNPVGGSLTARPDIADYYQVARDVAAAQGLLLIDHYPNWLDLYNTDPTTWSSYLLDQVHPNTLGYQNILMPELQQALEAAGGEPVVTNGDGVTNVTHSAAELTGYLVSTGAAPATVHVYWGMTNGFDVIDDWDHTAEVAIGGVGPLTYAVSNLAANTAYYYRFFGTNALGATWATPSERFSTPGAIPFSDDFEGRLEGDLDGQNGWTGSGAAVQTNEVYEGNHAVSINGSQGAASHLFGDGETAGWTDLYVQPVFGTCADGPPAGSTFGFYINTNGVVVAFDGSTATQLVGAVVQSNQWSRFTVHSDHVNTNWSLWVNGVSAATELDFYSAGAGSYTELTVKGTWGGTTYMDDVNIALSNPLGGRKGTVVYGK